MNNLPISLLKSLEGKYFVGQSKLINFGNDGNAWFALVNPKDSTVNVFLNTFNITNYCKYPFAVQIWISNNYEDKGEETLNVISANTALNPIPKPKAKLKFEQGVTGMDVKGINPFNRIILPSSSTISEEHGKFIMPPGGAFVIFAIGRANQLIRSKIAFGWWEEEIKK